MQERMVHTLDIPEHELSTNDENDDCSRCVPIYSLINA